MDQKTADTAKIYIAKIKTPPNGSNWQEPRAWCETNTEKPWRYAGFGAFVFDSERDLAWFLLRWS
jgi:hypothetical protein